MTSAFGALYKNDIQISISAKQSSSSVYYTSGSCVISLYSYSVISSPTYATIASSAFFGSYGRYLPARGSFYGTFTNSASGTFYYLDAMYFTITSSNAWNVTVVAPGNVGVTYSLFDTSTYGANATFTALGAYQVTL